MASPISEGHRGFTDTGTCSCHSRTQILFASILNTCTVSYRLGNLTNLIEVGKKSLLLHRVPSTKQCSPSGPPNGHNNSVTCILWQHLRSTRALQPPTCSATPATPLKVLSRCIHSRHNRCAAPASQSPICTYSARYASAPAPMQRTARHQMISTTLVRINIHNHHAYMG